MGVPSVYVFDGGVYFSFVLILFKLAGVYLEKYSCDNDWRSGVGGSTKSFSCVCVCVCVCACVVCACVCAVACVWVSVGVSCLSCVVIHTSAS